MTWKKSCQCCRRGEGTFTNVFFKIVLSKRTKALANNFTHKTLRETIVKDLKLIKLVLSLKLPRDMYLINGRSWQYYPLFPFSVIVYRISGTL